MWYQRVACSIVSSAGLSKVERRSPIKDTWPSLSKTSNSRRLIRGVTTPGESPSEGLEHESDQPLSEKDAARFRALAARANDLAADRIDIMYSVKEICRAMAKPTMNAWLKLKRRGRYLKDHGRLTAKYKWQDEESHITGYSDSDWAGCRVTGKSTSSGVIVNGSHFL